MSVEIVGALAIMACAALVVLVTCFAAPRQPRSLPAPTMLSAADQRLLPYLQLTPAQWLALTDHQRAELRRRAYRTMS